MALAQQRTRIFSLRPLRTTAVLWCEADALQAAGAAAGAGTVAATFGPSAPAHAHQKLGEHHTQAPTRGTGTVSSKLKVDVQDVARLCSRKSHVKVGRRLRAARRLQLGWVGAFAGREGYLWHVAPPRLPPTPAPAESSRSEGGDIHRPKSRSKRFGPRVCGTKVTSKFLNSLDSMNTSPATIIDLRCDGWAR